ncbi:methyltransferase [Streptomyces sp. NPDC019224]|uniref:methyltransferase n=1 Tax=Streptomyces sp. NPDC019224 TaxID=3154484 RepID=UPI00340A5E4A
MSTMDTFTRSPAEIELAPDLSTLTSRVPEPDGTLREVRQSPVHSLLVDSFEALADGRAGGAVVTYGDLQVKWRPDGATYQLNLDAFRFIHAVSGLLPAGARILDVGSGTGVLGLGVATFAEVRQLCLLDYNPGATRQAQNNCRTFTRRNPDVAIRLVQGRFHSSLQTRVGEHDVLISNPPYFPPALLAGRDGRTRLTDDFGLTPALLTDGLAFAHEVYFMYSTAAEPEIAELMARRTPGSCATTVATWQAPFPSHLLSPLGRKRFATNGPDSRWDAWHEVRIVRLSRT